MAKWLTSIWIPVVVFILISLLSIYGLMVYSNHAHSKDGTDLTAGLILLKELSFAGLVASILGLTLEVFNSIRHGRIAQALANEVRDEVSKQAFLALFKKYVPEGIVNHVMVHVLQNSIVRVKYENSYALRKVELPGGQFAVRLTGYQKFRFRNCSLRSDDCCINFCVERNMEIDDPKSLITSYTVAQPNGKAVKECEGQTLQKLLTVSPSRDKCFLNDQIKMNSGEEFDAMFEFEQHQPLQGSHFICTLFPCEEMTIEVDDPDRAFEISAMSMHPVDERLISPKSNPKRKWVVNNLIPGQGISFSWRPRNLT